MTYNGWTNYETWNVALWLDNDQGEQEHWTDRAEELERYELKSELRDFFNENNPLSGDASCYADLLSDALDTVNWYEIVDHLIVYAEERKEYS